MGKAESGKLIESDQLPPAVPVTAKYLYIEMEQMRSTARMTSTCPELNNFQSCHHRSYEEGICHLGDIL